MSCMIQFVDDPDLSLIKTNKLIFEFTNQSSDQKF
jgi:hypothetical protein